MTGDFIPPSRKLYLTPDAPVEGRFCRQLSIPDTPEWVGLVDGLLSTFAEPETWRQFGDLTPEATAEAFLAILLESWALDGCGVSSDVPAPFWDDPDAADADDQAPASEQDWYFELGDWILAGFLAVTATPEAGIVYLTTIKPIVVKLRTGSAGAIVNMLVDGELVDAVDTWSNVAGTIDWQYNIPASAAPALLAAGDPHELRIEHSGTHNPDATPSEDGYTISIIRDYLGRDALGQPVTRINPDTGVFETTPDGGETWVANPDADPRRQITFPPLTGGSEECRGAASIVAVMQSRLGTFLDAMQDGMSIFAGANFVLGLIQFAFFGFPVWSVFYSLVDGIVGIGIETVEDALDEEAYDTLRCILLTLLDGSGRMPEANMPRLYQALYQQLPTIPAQVFDLFFDGVGFGGLSNFAAQDADPTFDCDCVTCPLSVTDTTIGGFSWRMTAVPEGPNTPVFVESGGHNGATSWQLTSTFNASAGWQTHAIYDLGQDCYMQSYALWARWSLAAGFRSCIVRLYNEAGTLVYNTSHITGGGTAWQQFYRLIGVGTGRYLHIILQANASAGQPYMSGTIEMYGS